MVDATFSFEFTVDAVVGEIDRLTPALVRAEHATEASREAGRVLVFELGGSTQACPLEHVAEVQRMPAVTALPNSPHWLSGVANLRGEVVSIVDLHSFFDLPAATSDSRRRVLILRSLKEDLRVGVIIDRLVGIRTQFEVQTGSIDSSTSEMNQYLSGVFVEDQKPIGVVDVERLLASPELRQFD